MKLHFRKYQGTGNDFVIIDDRKKMFPFENRELVERLCNRRFGIGADGLILLRDHPDQDFEMIYYNSDGNQSTMCGNGGRCVVRFAHDLEIISNETVFLAVDGLHDAKVFPQEVSLKMVDTEKIKSSAEGFFIDTGSPHHVQVVEDLDVFNVFHSGREIRNAVYGKEGANVNFVEAKNGGISVRTYERGVEDETLSCGTGVTAAAITSFQRGWVENQPVKIETKGGNLMVSFNENPNGFSDIWLTGPAQFVFEGEIEI